VKPLLRATLLAVAVAALSRDRPALADATPPADTRVPELEAALKALVGKVKDAQIGVEIVDVASGKILASHDEHLPLNPASNAKIYTAAAALATLHGDHRFTTTLSGVQKGSAVSNLTLRGHGDPSLRTSDLYALAEDLRAHGVKKVDGDLLVDQRGWDDQTTPPAFEQKPDEWAAFRAPVSAVAVNENTIVLSVRPGAEGKNAQIAFDPPGFVDAEGTVSTVESGADNVTLVLSPSGRRLSAKVGGTIAQGSRLVRYTRRVDDPQLLAGYALRAILDEIGVKIGADVKLATGGGRGAVIARRDSEPLSALLHALGKQSDNFYAEMIFKSLSGETRKPAQAASSAEVVARLLERHDLGDTGVVIKNGSGLYDANRVTAHSAAKLLRWAYRDPAIGPEFVAHLATGGVDGTLHKRLGHTHRTVRAKTGTLDDVIALSGYVLAGEGRSPIAFSIIFNRVQGKGATARSAADTLVGAIYRYLNP
jgi:D-alanyl-D-alanine carboxypeptidase/D-alanyl-D-alanine-endopeptidase (penicillin-binding protein 4)